MFYARLVNDLTVLSIKIPVETRNAIFDGLSNLKTFALQCLFLEIPSRLCE